MSNKQGSYHNSDHRSSRGIVKVNLKSRRRCNCGCNGRATHIGTGDGAGMMGGCELTVRRWVRDGYKH